jgi:hypothetical protein
MGQGNVARAGDGVAVDGGDGGDGDKVVVDLARAGGGLARSGAALNRIRREFFGPADALLAGAAQGAPTPSPSGLLGSLDPARAPEECTRKHAEYAPSGRWDFDLFRKVPSVCVNSPRT